MEQKATLGRIVHYVLENGQQRPAIVTSGDNTEEIHLLVFCDINDGTGPTVYKVGVPFNTGARPGTWHWPERTADG